MSGPRIALVDPASFVLPFDHYLARALAAEGIEIDFYCSRTTANAELVDCLKRARGITVFEYSVSSTVTGRLSGVFNYGRMCLAILRRVGRYQAVILEYSILPALELLAFWPFRRKLWLQVHEVSGLAGRTHAPFFLKVLKKLARRLLFASASEMAAYQSLHPGSPERLLLTRHGVLPVVPEDLRLAVNEHVEPSRVIVFWGLVKPYKGVDLLARIAESKMFEDFAFEVHGRWHASALPTKLALMQKGVLVEDSFLEPKELRRLLSRPVLFILPYRSGSQSGVLYTLLNYGCVFISTDVGDNGKFLRDHGFERLLFDREDMASVHAAVRYAYEHFGDLRRRLLRIRGEFDWSDGARAVAQCLKQQ